MNVAAYTLIFMVAFIIFYWGLFASASEPPKQARPESDKKYFDFM